MDVSRQLRALSGIRSEPFEKNLENPAKGENEHYRTIFFCATTERTNFFVTNAKDPGECNNSYTSLFYFRQVIGSLCSKSVD